MTSPSMLSRRRDAGLVLLVGAEKFGPHRLEAQLLFVGDLFGRLGGGLTGSNADRLAARVTVALPCLAGFAAFDFTATDDVHHRDDDRAALGLFVQIVRDVLFEFLLESVEVDALEALLDGAAQLNPEAVH